MTPHKEHRGEREADLINSAISHSTGLTSILPLQTLHRSCGGLTNQTIHSLCPSLLYQTASHSCKLGQEASASLTSTRWPPPQINIAKEEEEKGKQKKVGPYTCKATVSFPKEPNCISTAPHRTCTCQLIHTHIERSTGF